MPRKSFLLAAVLSALVAVPAVTVAGGGTTAAKKKRAKGFTPKVLKGSWSGTWKNQTFGTTGPITAKFTAKRKKLGIPLDFGGSVFGCADPPAASITLPKGKGANKWSKKGFTLDGPSAAFGQRVLTYKHKTRKVTGKGQDPPCAQGLTWTLSGKVSKKYRRLTAKVNINLANGGKAVSVLDVKKK